jgi:hypothetical protein
MSKQIQSFIIYYTHTRKRIPPPPLPPYKHTKTHLKAGRVVDRFITRGNIRLRLVNPINTHTPTHKH